jgi:phosphinothricin acetyltransferase
MVSYAPTVELTLFIHPDYQSRAIGSALLAQFLGSVETGQVWHTCEGMGGQIELSDQNDENASASATQVRNVIAVMAVDPEGKGQGEALRTWYLKRGFEECGRMRKVGFKRGHW